MIATPPGAGPALGRTARTGPGSLAEWATAREDGLSGFAIRVDRFDAVRDVLGSHAAEALVRTVRERLAGWAGPDGRADWLGGARFVAALAGDADPLAAAGRVRDLVVAPLQLAGLVLTRSASVGVALDPTRDVPIAELLARAGRACDSVQAAGGDGVALFDATADAARVDRLRLDLELHEALTGNALRLHYQPEFELRTGELLAAEALLRWQHPRLGLLGAPDFIDTLERSHTFAVVQGRLFDECCRLLAGWTDVPDLVLRTNVPGVRLAESGTVDALLSALARHAVRAERICVEVTERHMPRDLAPLAEQVIRLRQAGVSVALDDVGTGQSTLAQLRVLPVDVVKIDRSFVGALSTDARAEAIVAGLIGMARSLGLDVVAEGVDGPQTTAALVRLGCHRGQGNALAPAMAATELRALCRGSGPG